jgi:hypothetical protein
VGYGRRWAKGIGKPLLSTCHPNKSATRHSAPVDLVDKPSQVRPSLLPRDRMKEDNSKRIVGESRRRAIRISDLSTVMAGSWPAMVITGNGESGLDSGEGA